MKENLPLVIVNPAAGGGSAGRDWTSSAAKILGHFGPFETSFTRQSGDAAQIAESQSRAGRRLLIAFGGDGTISEVARGIVLSGTTSELGVLPRGTGSDFGRSLELPSRLIDAAHALRNSRTLAIDVGRVAFESRTGQTETRTFVNSASFGLSGEVAEATNRSFKALGGKIAFASRTVKSAFRFDPPDVYLQVEDESPRRTSITMVCLNNGRFFGGGMNIAPHASLVDGRLDLVVVRKLSFIKILTKGPLLYTGAHLGLPEVDHRTATSVRARPLNSSLQIPIEIDGESPGFLPAHFEICPKALRLRVPIQQD
jgi:YegS/Rv2252/BmrU family lipid kinase